jgi:hypothetical protein
LEGAWLGDEDGALEGAAEGAVEGAPVGAEEGAAEGAEEGAAVGTSVSGPVQHSAWSAASGLPTAHGFCEHTLSELEALKKVFAPQSSSVTGPLLLEELVTSFRPQVGNGNSMPGQ